MRTDLAQLANIAFSADAVRVDKRVLADLVDILAQEHDVVAPVARDGSIALGKITRIDQLAKGYRDVQSPGHYRLEEAADAGVFSYANGMESPKKYLHPSRLTICAGQLHRGGFEFEEEPPPVRKLAFLGIRPCDCQSILVLDKTFLSQHVDEHYRSRREGSFVAVVNCTRPGDLCFCASMGSGPKADRGFDLALTELKDGFLVEPGSDTGWEVLRQLTTRKASQDERLAAASAIADTAAHMGRTLDTSALPQLLRGGLDHPHWDLMKSWCIGCANCTMVCPTCFCYSIADQIDFKQRRLSRERVWDSCFTWQFTEVHGCNFRDTLRSRYRHWACHKLGYWVEQYGVFGCVGCGRCITWCPVGIDITAVATSVRRERQ
ncbi:MAG: 4Fe-4S dicluster domain-containing protein [Chloroflexi bacterium]|nr:4Fe-4S dicluster domain-containing protein [Chloroflexota bacterium]